MNTLLFFYSIKNIIFFIAISILCCLIVIATYKVGKKRVLRKIAGVERQNQSEIKVLKNELTTNKDLVENWKSCCNYLVEFSSNPDTNKRIESHNFMLLKQMATYAELHCDEETNSLISELTTHCESLNVGSFGLLPEVNTLRLDIAKTVRAIESRME